MERYIREVKADDCYNSPRFSPIGHYFPELMTSLNYSFSIILIIIIINYYLIFILILIYYYFFNRFYLYLESNKL
jgi:hypothetical protein